ncbi:hypothetical protein K469DRAFT_135872 [Zopfia rhizophila CBS 207.26]|uniref:Uncharacterized protein n=1 Tax=Zopfia rhizophila CBS 207.26 TaxID=1314779 RepID=A0A6A6ETA9_9PEZI|nr:hypothetical protein K469DRAFT_135872 [Zopfia rhizophila CBS 207.26]
MKSSLLILRLRAPTMFHQAAMKVSSVIIPMWNPYQGCCMEQFSKINTIAKANHDQCRAYRAGRAVLCNAVTLRPPHESCHHNNCLQSYEPLNRAILDLIFLLSPSPSLMRNGLPSWQGVERLSQTGPDHYRFPPRPQVTSAPYGRLFIREISPCGSFAKAENLHVSTDMGNP